MGKIDSWYDQVPVISTEYLILRPFEENDLSAIKDIYEDTTLYRFFGRGKNSIEKNPEYLFDKEIYDAKKVNILRWGIAKKRDNKIIGEIMLYDIEEDISCRMGCRIAKKEQRKGIATEATKAITGYFYRQGVFEDLQADVMKGNVASYRALEHCGFVNNGEMRGGRYYVYRYEYPRKIKQ